MVLAWWFACAHPMAPRAGDPRADVVSVDASGESGAYTFGAAIRSDETGCAQYADWWEVLTPEGDLVYRRILDHSHPDEQPFLRTGGPVEVQGDEDLVVRAHLHLDGSDGPGYDGIVLRGTVDAGFSAWTPPDGFAESLSDAEPLPASCLF